MSGLLRTDRFALLASAAADLRNLFLGSLAAPLDLLLRLLIAQGFVSSGVLKLADWSTALALATYEYPVSWLSPTLAASLGLMIELVAGSLFALGLVTRPAALALAALALVVQFEYRPLNIHLFTAFGLLWYVISGAHGLSMDHLLGKGVGDSALPGGAKLAKLYGWVERVLAAPLNLLLRWLTVILIGLALHTSVAEPVLGFDLQPLSIWFHRSTLLDPGPGQLLLEVAVVGNLERAAWTLALALLALGLATRLTAAALLLVWLSAAAGLPHDAIVLGDLQGLGLLLTLLLVNGAGRLSLDRPLWNWLQQQRVPLVHSEEAQRLPHVVVVGAGFGGLGCVRALRHAPCRITLIDQHNYHLFPPLLYQVATAGLSPADIATPIRELLRQQSNVRVRMATVTGIDSRGRQLQLGDQTMGYEFLVLATGAQHSYFGKDHWQPYAPGLKRIEDGLEVRRRLLLGFENAESAASATERHAWMTFVIVGGGPTGVELAGAIAELAQLGMDQEFNEIDPRQARVILVQSAERLLPTFPAALSARTEASLRALGIDVRLNSRVEQIDAAGVLVNGGRIEARTVLWAAGVAASPAARWLGAEHDRAGRVLVDEHLRVPNHGPVFAIGDTAASNAWQGQPVPGLAPAAKQGGAHVAQCIRAALGLRSMPAAFRYRHYGSLATIGRKSAVADLNGLRLSGPLAWWFWGAIHVLFLASLRNRAAVAMEWLWAYLTFRRSTRLITGAPTGTPTHPSSTEQAHEPYYVRP